MPSSKDHNSKTDRHTVAQVAQRDDGTFNPRLIVVSGVMLGFQFELGDAAVTIGRASECGLALQHPSVSRQHCKIWRDGTAFQIEDLDSTNHTYVNGKAITRAMLRDGDQINVGNNAIKFFTSSSIEANYHHELIDLAIYDSLSGFFNRRHFRALLDEELEKAQVDVPLSLLIADLDHFKRVNDEYGHLVGDQVLSGVARTMREHAPQGVLAGRLGGEEFALVVRAELSVAAALAETLRAAVQAHPIEAREHTLAVTVSIGVAEHAGDVANSADLLRLADVRLYRAKQDGRNRVCSED